MSDLIYALQGDNAEAKAARKRYTCVVSPLSYCPEEDSDLFEAKRMDSILEELGWMPRDRAPGLLL